VLCSVNIKNTSILKTPEMMLRTFLPLPILGFVIFLMVDSQKRFKEMKKLSPKSAADYERQFALLITLLVVLAIVLISAAMYGFMLDSPTKYRSWFGEPPASVRFIEGTKA
jgi:Na+/H+ antiporter NhaC